MCRLKRPQFFKLIFLLLASLLLNCSVISNILPSNSEAPNSSVSQSVLLSSFEGENGSSGYIDQYGRVVIPPQFDMTSDFHEGLALVSKDSLLGYIDEFGHFVIPPKFARAKSFSDGLAPVSLPGNVGEPGYPVYGYIDHSGKFVIQPREFPAIFKSFVLTSEEDISYGDSDPNRLYSIAYFHEGYRLIYDDVMINYKSQGSNISVPCSCANFLDHNGNLLSPDKKYGYLYSATRFSEGLASVEFLSDPLGSEGKKAYIDTKGNVIFYHNFDYAYPFSDGLAQVMLGTKYGFIDKTGKVVIPPTFANAESFSDDRSAVQNEENGLWGFIDRGGNLVIDYKYQEVGYFLNGLAVVGDENHKVFIDINGNPAFPSTTSFQPQFPQFYNGLMLVWSDKIKDNVYINTKGQVVRNYSDAPTPDFSPSPSP